MIHAAVWWLINQFLRFVVKIDTKIDNTGEIIIVINNDSLIVSIVDFTKQIFFYKNNVSFKSKQR